MFESLFYCFAPKLNWHISKNVYFSHQIFMSFRYIFGPNGIRFKYKPFFRLIFILLFRNLHFCCPSLCYSTQRRKEGKIKMTIFLYSLFYIYNSFATILGDTFLFLIKSLESIFLQGKIVNLQLFFLLMRNNILDKDFVKAAKKQLRSGLSVHVIIYLNMP